MAKIIVLRFSSLGDVILTTSVLKPLADMGHEVSLITYKPFDNIFEDSKFVKVYGIEKANIFSTIKSLNHDIIIDLQKNFTTLPIRLVFGNNYYTYNKHSIKRRLCVIFKAFKDNMFYITDEYAKAVNSITDITNPRPFLEVSNDRLVKFLSDKPVVSMGIGARYAKKRYKYFKTLSWLFMKKGFEIRLLGGVNDFTDADGINYVGKLSLIDTLACIKSSKLVISNDSAITHMARSVGVKVVSIYGATHPCFGFAPKEEEGIFISKDMPCKPCDLHGKGDCKYKTYPCLDIEPEFIFKKSLNLLKI